MKYAVSRTRKIKYLSFIERDKDMKTKGLVVVTLCMLLLNVFSGCAENTTQDEKVDSPIKNMRRLQNKRLLRNKRPGGRDKSRARTGKRRSPD